MENAIVRKRTLFITMLVLFMGISLNAQTGPWVSAYYAGWNQGQANDGALPAQNIDYGALTHVIHFSLVPNSNGTLDYSSNSITQANSSALVQAAHAAGKKALICVGGWATDGGFLGATGSATLPTFVSNLVAFMTSRGYDGVDIDWEPLNPGDGVQYTALITALRTALDAVSPRPLLTAATAWQPSILALVQSMFDQINIMTYDLSGAWGGWVTWHNSAIYDGGYTFPSTGGPVPSANGMVDGFTAAGIAAGKIGIGIDFYAYVWSGGSGTPAGGATEPRQSWSGAPSVQSNLPYSSMMQTYYQPQYVHWDTSAQAAYLDIDNAGSADDKFISYDDETTCQSKIQYTRDKHIGGVIIWELGGGYLPSSFPNRDRLLQAVKQALGSGTPSVPPAPLLASPANGATGVATASTLTWNTSSGAASYRVQVSASSAFSTSVVDQSGLSATSSAISGLVASTAYYWRVNATNSAGTSAWSGASSFTTGPPPVVAWKLVSVPVTVADPRTTVLFPTATSSAFMYNPAGGFTATASLRIGIGYWLKFGADQTPNFQGTSVLAETIDVQRGWNLIGSISSPVPVSAVSSLPPNITTSNFFSFSNGYDVSQTIDPGNGYWVKVAQSGKLILSSSSRATSANRVIISPNGETPPPPPQDLSVRSGETPQAFSLAQNFPNPFNPTTTIQFDLPKAGHATLKVYNSLGEEVAALVAGDLPAGSFQTVWNAGGMPSGTYFYRLITGDFSQTRKLVLMK